MSHTAVVYNHSNIILIVQYMQVPLYFLDGTRTHYRADVGITMITWSTLLAGVYYRADLGITRTM